MLTIAAGAVTPAEVTLFLLSLAVLLGLAKLLGEAARALRQPSVLGEILAGVLLGPTVLGGWFPGLYDGLFPTAGNTFVGLSMLITLAVVLLLLVAGLEVDLSTVWQQGRAALLVSAAGMVIPFALGFVLAWLLPDLLGLGEGAEKVPFALFVGIALSITALPVIAKILMDLNMAKSDIGAIIMSSAMLNDLVGWVGFAVVLSLIQPTGEAVEPSGAPGGVVVTLVLTLLFVGALLTVGRFAVNRLLPAVQAHTSWPGGVLVFVFVVAIFCAAFTEWIGIHSIFGAFIAGVAIGDSRHLRERTRDTIHQFVTNIFAPLFFASIGLRVNFIDDFDWAMVVVVLLVACAGKIGGCYLGAKLGGLQERESWAVGGGMVARGAMEIILAQLAFEAGLIGERFFVAIVIMALVPSLIAGPIMKSVLRQKERRSLVHFVSDRTFLPHLKAHDGRQAIAEMASAAGKVLQRDADEIFRAAWEREQIQPSGLPHGLAVPHARLGGIKRSVVVVGISERGLDFDSPDGEPDHIICMLLSPETDPTAQLELLDAVARAFTHPEARHLTREAKSFTQFRAAMRVTSDVAHQT